MVQSQRLKQIWTGPVLQTDRPKLIERCRELIALEGPGSVLYIAASAPLLQLVTASILDSSQLSAIWGRLPVYLFRGLVARILETAIETETGLPVPSRTSVDTDEFPLHHGLVSQVVRRLAADGKLQAIGRLALTDGGINTLATLIGEIERAAISAGELQRMFEARAVDRETPEESVVPLQQDYDRDVFEIYQSYSDTLKRHRLTERDADQLRALHVLRAELEAQPVTVPWLDGVKLLVVDGFFDFTPVQGEILRLLIPRIPQVIVNLNFDPSNPTIFAPFDQTIHQLGSMADFEIRSADQPRGRIESFLRQRLFNPAEFPASADDGSIVPSDSQITIIECSDRETEIRQVAKEIKTLVTSAGYRLPEIALVAREKASYAATIARVMTDERVPCALQRRVPLAEIPATRAAIKLFRLLAESTDTTSDLKISELAGLLKSDYFRLSRNELIELRTRFYQQPWLTQSNSILSPLSQRTASGEETNAIGRWDIDSLENAMAYVGSELRIVAWLRRARRLTAELRLPSPDTGDTPEDEEQLLAEPPAEDDIVTPAGDSAIQKLSRPGNRKPARAMHPGAIAWAAFLVGHLGHVLNSARQKGDARQLRSALASLLDRFNFASDISRRARMATSPAANIDFDQACLDLRAVEGIRRAMSVAARALQFDAHDDGKQETTFGLGMYIDEILRAIRSQTIQMADIDSDGLQVLEATDIRGLRFRAVFVVGLNEGGFPLRPSRDWLYPHEERERLKQYGLTLEDISPETLLKEEHYFYQAACRATKRLYLTRPLVLDDGSETVASYYLEEIKRAANDIRASVVRRDFDGQEIGRASTGIELAISAIRQEERMLHPSQRLGTLEQRELRRVCEWLRSNRFLNASIEQRIAIERARSGPRFGPFDGSITAPELVALTSDEFDEEHVFSASELSLYGKCPYKFFAQRILKLESRAEAALDLAALDAGSLLHEVLRRFLSPYRGRRLDTIDPGELHARLSQVADEVFDEHEQLVPPLNPNLWRIDREIRKLVLEQVLDHEMELQAKTEQKNVLPAFFELAFGMNNEQADECSRSEFLRLAHDGGRALLRGQIDRVDRARDGTAIAYDYKLSRGASLEDMIEGRDLQLHVYLAALENLFLPESDIAGAGYYVLRGDRGRKKGMYKESKQAYTAVSGTKSTMSDPEWSRAREQMQARIFEFIERIRRAEFHVDPSAPRQTCSYCDFAAVCRYDKFRIAHKQNPQIQA